MLVSSINNFKQSTPAYKQISINNNRNYSEQQKDTFVKSFGSKGFDSVSTRSKFPINDTVNNLLVQYYPQLFINKYINEKTIKKAVKTNPNIGKILSSKGLSPEIYMSNVEGKSQKHFLTTYECAKKIAQFNKLNSKNTNTLLKAALLHDIGKSLIPSQIIDKPGRLTPEEREIVDLHANLGYEILKTTDIPEDVAEIVRLHHTDWKRNDKRENPLSQILSVADVYSALKEERSYKPVMSDAEASHIMQNDTKLKQCYVNEAFINKKPEQIFFLNVS